MKSSLVAGELPDILAALQSQLPPDVLTKVLPGLISDVLNYNDPEAQRAYVDYVTHITERYHDRRAIGAWILGNEFA